MGNFWKIIYVSFETLLLLCTVFYHLPYFVNPLLILGHQLFVILEKLLQLNKVLQATLRQTLPSQKLELSTPFLIQKTHTHQCNSWWRHFDSLFTNFRFWASKTDFQEITQILHVDYEVKGQNGCGHLCDQLHVSGVAWHEKQLQLGTHPPINDNGLLIDYCFCFSIIMFILKCIVNRYFINKIILKYFSIIYTNRIHF